MMNGTEKLSYKTPRMRDHISRFFVPDPALVIIATLVIGGVVAYRIWKKHDSNW